LSENAAILRKLLWAYRLGAQFPIVECSELHRTTSSQLAAHIRSGEVLPICRCRIESIIDELEGKEPRKVDYDQIFADRQDQFEKRRESLFEEGGRRRVRRKPGTKLEAQRQKIIAYMRENPPNLTKAGICRALGFQLTMATYLFNDPRFVCAGRRMPVQLDEREIERHELTRHGGRSDASS